MKIAITLSGLIDDGVSVSENMPYRRATIILPDSASDLAASRAILAAVGAQGFQRDDWCPSDFGPWRSGTLGVYADVVPD